MGFWSDLGETIVSGVEKIGGAIATSIEKTGEAVGGAIEFVLDTAYDVWDNLTSSSKKTAKKIGQLETYDQNTANIETTDTIIKILSEYKNISSNETHKLEDKLEKICSDIFDKLNDELEKIDFDTKFLRYESKRILRDIRGSIKREVISKISIDNDECNEILKQNSGHIKQKAMKNFIDDITKKAIINHKELLQNKISEIISRIKENLDSKYSQLQTITKQNLDYVEMISKNTNTMQIQEKQMQIAKDLAINICMRNNLHIIRNLKRS